MWYRYRRTLDLRLGECSTIVGQSRTVLMTQINMMQGRVDLSFRIIGTKGMSAPAERVTYAICTSQWTHS